MYSFFKRRHKLGLIGIMLATGLTASVAMAAHVPSSSLIFPAPIGVNPGAVGKPFAPFITDFVTFNYQAVVDQVATGPGTATFVEQGVAFYNAFLDPVMGFPYDASDTGLGAGAPNGYRMYASFSATGSTTLNGAGGLDGMFSTFALTILVDVNRNTASNFGSVGVGGANENLALTNTADDIAVASTNGDGLLVPFGGFHIFAGLANGDFDVIIDIDAIGGFFTWPAGLSSAFLDFNGGFSSLAGVSAGSFIDAKVTGNGDMSAAVIPEPGTLLLLGTGLAAIGFLRFRRKDA